MYNIMVIIFFSYTCIAGPAHPLNMVLPNILMVLLLAKSTPCIAVLFKNVLMKGKCQPILLCFHYLVVGNFHRVNLFKD